ncbi:DNA mismatch repair protein [Flavobacterium faecale]|uniref:DNA mismatch repair protein n=1 Tax=Flavobacterium faecale TaxID=1355330 RepID=A0A2S1LEM3_9FLAO|nr:DNA mismatch repair protein [Flavobacterium faecale]AWG21986.1 DNA mismatch repair protein [Flavobacterium faecale]
MKIYHSIKSSLENDLKVINRKYSSISIVRLITIAAFICSIYFYIQNGDLRLIFLTLAFFIGFLILMRVHSKLQFQKEVEEALLDVNVNEIDFLENKKLPYENGIEFNDFHHPYAYDLDIFGEHSLFQNLNRTATFIGKKTLAEELLNVSSIREIEDNQEAIHELTSKLEWRQDFNAFAKIANDNETVYKELLYWSKFNSRPLPKWAIWFSYLSPIFFLICLIGNIVSSNSMFGNAMAYIVVFNLMVLGAFMKRIQIEVANSGAIDKICKQYSFLLQKIENEDFKSLKLKDMQQILILHGQNSSVHLERLSGLFSNNDAISNLFTAVLFNGTFLFNLHILNRLIAWKKEHAHALEEWLVTIGKFEALSSLANFAYNNPDFVYPQLNDKFEIQFKELSHPLLNSKTRVGNDVSFNPQSFMILTGSNMSGKSTFLRSLGINMVLSGVGSVVCASEAKVHPLPVLVSMRLSDSLTDSESYFYAEIKRLKQIMDALEEQPAFVLLDEILRGTNSDDKRNGTIEVVKKVIAQKAVGAIATHDIEVCLTTNEFPDTLINKCFEVEIVNDDLHFDYKLRDGVCQNKSASFLMKKMGVI